MEGQWCQRRVIRRGHLETRLPGWKATQETWEKANAQKLGCKIWVKVNWGRLKIQNKDAMPQCGEKPVIAEKFGVTGSFCLRIRIRILPPY